MPNSPFDPEIVRQLQNIGGAHFWQTILGRFMDTAWECISDMARHYHNNMPRELFASAHQLKGTSGMVGATAIAELCKQLEELCKQDNLTNTWPVIQKIELELIQAQIHLPRAPGESYSKNTDL